MEEQTEPWRGQSCPLGCWHWPAGAQARVSVIVLVMNCYVTTTPKLSGLERLLARDSVGGCLGLVLPGLTHVQAAGGWHGQRI